MKKYNREITYEKINFPISKIDFFQKQNYEKYPSIYISQVLYNPNII